MSLARGKKMFSESRANALQRVQCWDTRPGGICQTGGRETWYRFDKVKKRKGGTTN